MKQAHGWLAGPKIALYFLHLFVCAFRLTMHATLVDLTDTLSTSVATTNTCSLAELWIQDTEEQRHRRHKADQEWKCWKQTAIQDAYRVTENGCQESTWMDQNVWRTGWCLDMKYQKCWEWSYIHCTSKNCVPRLVLPTTELELRIQSQKASGRWLKLGGFM